ncbi:MAG: DsrE family protein [Saprospiraceae bacterium]|nr:DsrE family protein [Saprospiraceae bacterium]
MKKLTVLAAILFLSVFNLVAQINPTIKKGGSMYAVPEAVSVGEWTQPYKIVMEVMNGVEKKDSLNPSLDRIARLYNLYRHSGVPKENIDISVMIHFTATPIIFTDEVYQKKFGVQNPNTALIDELAANGVKFYVCGQSIYKRKVENEPRNPNIKVVLSAMYGISILQMKGYAYMP